MNVSAPSVLTVDPASLTAARDNARRALLERLTPEGHWVGCLSPSALSTAVAVVALSALNRDPELVCRGLDWLAQHPEPDGGWGDTPGSPSNPSTTLLSWAALQYDPAWAGSHPGAIHRAQQWLERRLGSLEPEHLADRVLALYGNDRTFSVPILTLSALCGRLGPDARAWRHVPQLPFELAALPHQLFQWLRLPVVSYAIPALIAIGLARHRNGPGTALNPTRWLRRWLEPTVLRVLHRTLPASGGFLEAVPLTGFVGMALAASGLHQHPVAQAGAGFLRHSVRADGSWPIDVNLSTWLTSLGISALAVPGNPAGLDLLPSRARTIQWLTGQQHLREHPFTHAAPGGWAWTDLPGGVPDADDTAGALLALRHLDPDALASINPAGAGLRWLLDLQNRDGGVPTFCRGWLNLPFDRSCPDITAHALAAWAAWQDRVPAQLQARIERASARALRYLGRTQHADGTWLPLWFGSQHTPDHANPLYGTARVVLALSGLPPRFRRQTETPIARAVSWLVQAQQPHGGWGAAAQTPATIEETALALDALAAAQLQDAGAAQRGLHWLLQTTRLGTAFHPSPIGLYFARLWYSEELYPLLFTCSALSRWASIFENARCSMFNED